MSEFEIFRGTEGPVTKLFHVFVKRPTKRRENGGFYGPGLSQIHRAARMLDVAEPSEQIGLGIAPLLFIIVGSLRWWGLGIVAQGYGLIFLVCYTGYFFTLWVFLDRRLDDLDKLRAGSIRQVKKEALDTRLLRRRDAKNSRDARIAQAQEARRRGQSKAASAPADTPAAPGLDPAPAPSLDDLLAPDG